jgi:D-xylose 1-dehydrogenase (NADP+, D-xylono-1,5-lactone-forming)
MAASKVKIGLMGTANIAGKNKRGIDLSGNAELYAVASRSLEKAQAWAEAHGGVSKVYGSYEELLADPDVQAVYIPLPCAMHLEWAVKVRRRGRGVGSGHINTITHAHTDRPPTFLAA